MLKGEVAALRARLDSDIAVLENELLDDVATQSRSDHRPWRPVPPGSPESPFRVTGPHADPVAFSVVELASGELAGAATSPYVSESETPAVRTGRVRSASGGWPPPPPFYSPPPRCAAGSPGTGCR